MAEGDTREHLRAARPITPTRGGTLSSDVPLSGGRIGVIAFFFFLGKGLLWLLIPAALYFWTC